MRRLFIALLIVAAIAVGGGFIANTAYQAGLAANIATVQAGTDGAVVVPAYGYGWGGYGWGPGLGSGFGIFGFLGTLLVLFLLFGLIRAFAFRGRGGWGGPRGWGGPGGTHPWESRARERFDEWHRTAHDGPSAAS